MRNHAFLITLCALLAGCAIGPNHVRPDAPVPTQWRERVAAESAELAELAGTRPWWTLFEDETLSQLAQRVEVSNQNIAAFAAAFTRARASIAEQRAALFPQLTLNLGGTRSRTARIVAPSPTAVVSPGAIRTIYQGSVGATWEADVWGRVSRAIESARATADASESDLAAIRLTAQADLSATYLQLRATDAEIELVERTVAAFERSLRITRNRYEAGIAPRTDVLQAETQLASARADQAGLAQRRAQFEHAIAVLVGVAPGDFALPRAPWQPTVPATAVGVPSALLQRRPDIAAAERRVAAANALIGVEQTAYFPRLVLNGSLGRSALTLSGLANAAASAWSLGTQVIQIAFNAGATRARVEAALAAREESVATYRQTVLVAFQEVEDQLAALDTLAEQQALRREASQAADLAEQQVLNRYVAGRVGFVEVVAAQATALNARRALVQAIVARQAAAVGLIQAIGGGWRAADSG